MKYYLLKKLAIRAVLMAALGMSSVYATDSAPYNIMVPKIDTIVANFSIKVKLHSTGTSGINKPITYTLQGSETSTQSGNWVNIFGTGSNANTVVELSKKEPKRINVVVPMFDSNKAFKYYRLLFMDSTYQMLGTVPLQGNIGSIPGNTYVLKLQSGAPKQLTPTDSTGVLAKPLHPPKIDTLQDGRKVLMVWDDSISAYNKFFIRGMAYEVTPVGQPWSGGEVDTANGEPVYLADFNNGGGQICSPLPAGPFGTPNQSYCFDTDLTGYMHQYLNNTALPGADSHNMLLKSMWERDFKIMHAMGVNTIRVYHIDALVRDMTDFLDMAYEYGIYIIMPAPAPNSSQTFSGSPKIGRLLSWDEMTTPGNAGQPWSALMQLELARYAAHPAILAWAVGNETEADNGNAAAAKIEWLLAKTIKQFDSRLLVTATNQDHYNDTTNFQDYYNVFKNEAGGTYLDFYSINSYRGMSPNALQLSGMQTLFDLHSKLEPPYDLPLFISEWGKYDTYDWGDFDNLWGFNRLWRMILTNKSKKLLGLAYFEFSDEPVAKNLPEQHYMGLVSYALPNDYSTSNPMVIDRVVPKFKYYSGIKVPATTTGDVSAGSYQNYPAVNQAGVFNSFIGSNTHVGIIDTSIKKVPNIAYCAFNESPSPWSINPKGLKLDVTVSSCSAYTVTVYPAGGDTISAITLNGGIITDTTSNRKTGVIEIKVKGNNKNSATAKIGYSALGDIPKESTNTILLNNFESLPNIGWNSDKTKLTISLAPVDGDTN